MSRIKTTFLTAATLMIVASLAHAAPSAEGGAKYFGHVTLDMRTGVSTFEPAETGTSSVTPFTTMIPGDVFVNTGVTANAISSTALNSEWGDRVTMTGTGFVDENDFSVFNSVSSAGNLLTATFNISFFNGATSAFIGGYSTTPVSFGTGLPPGFSTLVTVTGLSILGINLTTTDIIMIQQAGTTTGTHTRLGVALSNAPTVGASTAGMYINSSTIGPAGFYTVGGNPANSPSYRINVSAVPVELSEFSID